MSLIEMSLSGAVLILTIIVIRAVALHKLPKKVFLVLWCIALLRLLVPFYIPSEFSVYSLLPQGADFQEWFRSSAAQTSTENAVSPALPTPLLRLGNTFTEGAGTGAGTGADPDTDSYNNGIPDTVFEMETPLRHLTAEQIGHLLTLLWSIGLFLCASVFVITYLRCYLEFRTSLPVSDARISKWLLEHPLKRPLQIRQSDKISAPLTYGIFRPVILLPKNTDLDNEQQLHYILLHEYTHIRRFDTATKLFLVAAVCLHWFNPLVWVMYLLFNRDIEFSCDERVMAAEAGDSRSAYATTLIHMEEARCSFMPLCNHFSKSAIEERITSIMKSKKTTPGMLLAGMFVVLLVSITLLPSAEESLGNLLPATPTPMPTATATPSPSPETAPDLPGTVWLAPVVSPSPENDPDLPGTVWLAPVVSPSPENTPGLPGTASLAATATPSPSPANAPGLPDTASLTATITPAPLYPENAPGLPGTASLTPTATPSPSPANAPGIPGTEELTPTATPSPADAPGLPGTAGTDYNVVLSLQDTSIPSAETDWWYSVSPTPSPTTLPAPSPTVTPEEAVSTPVELTDGTLYDLSAAKFEEFRLLLNSVFCNNLPLDTPIAPENAVRIRERYYYPVASDSFSSLRELKAYVNTICHTALTDELFEYFFRDDLLLEINGRLYTQLYHSVTYPDNYALTVWYHRENHISINYRYEADDTVFEEGIVSLYKIDGSWYVIAAFIP